MLTTVEAPPIRPAIRWPTRGKRCYYRQTILIAVGILLVGGFWIASRYPQLLGKVQHVNDVLPSMAYGSIAFPVDATDPAWQRILCTMGNWLNSMKIGMGFGVLLGGLLHTVLRYYPLKLGSNLYLNSVKGALVGVPAGVCANCSVPVACGVTRGAGKVEAALGFLFSSPNFNPVVVVMTFTVLPLSIAIAKYGILVLVIALAVPLLVRWSQNRSNAEETIADSAACAIDLSGPPCQQSFAEVLSELGRVYLRHVYELLRPTVVIMLCASLVSSAALVLIPWSELLSEITPGKVALASFLATAMPVPIALDVIFAGNLYTQGVPTGYVAMFAMTLGTYSVIPSIYLWREVSRKLAVALFLLFWAIGFISGLVF